MLLTRQSNKKKNSVRKSSIIVARFQKHGQRIEYLDPRFKPDELPIAASLSFFFIIFSSLLSGFLNPSSFVAISLSFLCAARRSSKLQKLSSQKKIQQIE